MRDLGFLGARFEKLRNLMTDENLDAALISSRGAKIHFGDLIDLEGYLIFFRDRKLLLSDSRFENELNAYASLFDILLLTGHFTEFMAGKKLLYGKRVGLELADLDYNSADFLIRNAGINSYKDISISISQITTICDNEILKRFRKAVEISHEVHNRLKGKIKSNVREKDISSLLTQLNYQIGSQGEPFSPIVAFGRNSGRPHHKPSMKKLSENENALVDFGSSFNGINSDVTRMFIKRTDKLSLNIYSVLRGIHEEVKKVAFPGIPVSELDAIARNVLKSEGLAEGIKHSLGHGLGYNVHQTPRISIYSKEVLHENQIITIEPGVYFPSGGYRLEDDYLVTPSGLKNLTKKIED